jgi:hypothetical protein
MLQFGFWTSTARFKLGDARYITKPPGGSVNRTASKQLLRSTMISDGRGEEPGACQKSSLSTSPSARNSGATVE